MKDFLEFLTGLFLFVVVIFTAVMFSFWIGENIFGLNLE